MSRSPNTKENRWAWEHQLLYTFFRVSFSSFADEFFYTYLPFDGSGNPSKVHDTCGVGFPAAEKKKCKKEENSETEKNYSSNRKQCLLNISTKRLDPVATFVLWSYKAWQAAHLKIQSVNYFERRLSCVWFTNGICGAYEYSHPANTSYFRWPKNAQMELKT